MNLQGVGDFDPNDPLYYAMEHCGADPRVKQLRWVNDSSVNLEFYNAQDAAAALGILTHAEVTNVNSMGPQESRRAKPFSKKPDSVLMIRETNQGDQKQRGAANRSTYYRSNPDVAGNRQREPRRRPPPKRDYLDYGDDDTGSREMPRRRRYERPATQIVLAMLTTADLVLTMQWRMILALTDGGTAKMEGTTEMTEGVAAEVTRKQTLEG